MKFRQGSHMYKFFNDKKRKVFHQIHEAILASVIDVTTATATAQRTCLNNTTTIVGAESQIDALLQTKQQYRVPLAN